ncbi:MAG: hypothetical protein WC829_01620 [Hyphomicrobium sp.]|jgi:hypothetical protein
MAMTKKEKAAMAEAIHRAELLSALRWTAPLAPDIPPPAFGTYSEGWTFNAFSLRVEKGWSTSTAHGSGPAPKDDRRGVSASQNSRHLYSTQAKALAALRHVVETEAAQKLLGIDRRLQTLSEFFVDIPKE